MSRRDAARIAPRQPDADGPIFEVPWHAEVLAIADALVGERLFAASDWADALGAALREAQARGDPDDASTYYACGLSALEGLIARHAPETWSSLPERVAQWRRAYLNTPHGQPVELAAGAVAAHHHGHDH